MHVRNLTVFENERLSFGRRLNVIVGENGTGKTHILKLAYAALAFSSEEGRKSPAQSPSKNFVQTSLASKLVNVFRPEELGRLVKRRQGRHRCDISLKFSNAELDTAFSFATNSKTEVTVDSPPLRWSDEAPVYLPTRELLTIYPNFVAVYEGHYLEFEETWRDTCILLGAPLRRGPTETQTRELLEPLEKLMEGSIELDRNGRFYLRTSSGRIEMPLVAEGLRKLAMLCRLIATGSLLGKGYLLWDEPEANLNPRVIKSIARSIMSLCTSGVQIFIATHSLFLLREIEILVAEVAMKKNDIKFFGLHKWNGGVKVEQGSSLEDIGDITSLDEELQQSDRFLSVEN